VKFFFQNIQLFSNLAKNTETNLIKKCFSEVSPIYQQANPSQSSKDFTI
jgi:hypothetical protein